MKHRNETILEAVILAAGCDTGKDSRLEWVAFPMGGIGNSNRSYGMAGLRKGVPFVEVVSGSIPVDRFVDRSGGGGE
jgi:hypothetical protein